MSRRKSVLLGGAFSPVAYKDTTTALEGCDGMRRSERLVTPTALVGVVGIKRGGPEDEIRRHHESLHPCMIPVEVCCTRSPYFAGERFNVFSHVVAFVGFLCWAILNAIFMHEGRGGAVGTAALIQTFFLDSLALVFGVSALYHSYNAHEGWSRWLRVVDYLCIYFAMSVQSIFIVYIIANRHPERQIPWQSLADPMIAMVLVTVVTVGRELDAIAMDIETYFKMEPCAPCRYAHVDGAYTVMRIGINVLFIGQWIRYIGAIYEEVPLPYNVLFLVSMGVTTAFVALTQVNDYYSISGAWVDSCSERCGKWCAFPHPHGIFHVVAFLGAALMAGVNEVLLRI